MTIISRKGKISIVSMALAALLISSIQIGLIIVNDWNRESTFYSNGGAMFVEYSYTWQGFRILIWLALLLSTSFLLTRINQRFLLSMLAAIGALSVYLYWLYSSIKLVRMTEAGEFSKLKYVDHIAYLLHANWLDISVLCVIIILIVWEISILLRPKYQ